ncbi:hypothetical protein QAD02_007080 [Eretmocerus hayati]|uniref:Uncharacterized protein n=1 Tax=Eretmocerus hayati TaxID=131215 RepID=A0ACC2N3X1_9HYME|nr:hypothetical protein QAD02_007080 [Eretmocerus hayati]
MLATMNQPQASSFFNNQGPNKYTRNWEDEDAYRKIPGNVPPHKPNFKKDGRANEEFPSLTKDTDVDKKSDQPVITSAWYSNKNKVPSNKTQNFPALQQTESQSSTMLWRKR